LTSNNKCIGVIPFEDVPVIVLKVIAAHISGYFNLPVQILPSIKLPEHAFDQRRLQYDAGILLRSFESIESNPCMKVIGVLCSDLYIPIFEYVYGEARQGEKCAVISIFRLGKNPDGSAPPESLVHERAAKVALHELGHLYNLFHCEDKNCLMHFSGGIGDLDATPLYLCRNCSSYLKYNISH
jgi:archaemetzincin